MISTMIALHCTAYDVPEINRISKFILPNYSWPEVFLFSFFSLSFPLYHWRITTTATIMWIEKNASLVFMLWKSSSDLQTRIRLCLLLGHFFLFKHFFPCAFKSISIFSLSYLPFSFHAQSIRFEREVCAVHVHKFILWLNTGWCFPFACEMKWSNHFATLFKNQLLWIFIHNLRV